jgi:hypothetical protein
MERTAFLSNPAAPALNDLLGGQIALIWASPIAVMPFAEQGKVKALAVSTKERFPLLPQAPTVAESAVPGFETANWFGVAAPARVPSEVIARVGNALREITALPDVQSRVLFSHLARTAPGSIRSRVYPSTRRLRHEGGTDHGAGSGPVLHDNRMLQSLLQLLGEDARGSIDRATRCKRHHQGNRPHRI